MCFFCVSKSHTNGILIQSFKPKVSWIWTPCKVFDLQIAAVPNMQMFLQIYVVQIFNTELFWIDVIIIYFFVNL